MKANVELIEAGHKDLQLILELQKNSFKDLLDKYKDYDINPGNETIEDIERRFHQPFTDYLLISYLDEPIGAVRIVKHESDKDIRISPVFIIPEYQGRGLSQETFRLIEERYKWVDLFKLDTILEEAKLCYLYEKLGYKKTGHYEKIKENMTIVYYEKEMTKN